jgi:receptor tyrosine kinase-like orphan receptor 1
MKNITKYKAQLNLDFAMKNITKYKGEHVRIRCEISGMPLPRYKWFKDDVPIRENEDRINSKITPWGARWVVSLNNLY